MLLASLCSSSSSSPISTPPKLTTTSTPPPSILTTPPSSPHRRTILLLASTLLLPPHLHLTRAQETDDPQQDEERVVNIFQAASPTVVFIKDLELNPSSNQTKRNPVAETAPTASEDVEDEDWADAKVVGTGSGFVWDKAGHVVTNYHVVAKLATDGSAFHRCKVFIQDPDGGTIAKEGRLVGCDPAYDLAVLKVDVEGDKLRPAPIGSSNDLRVGQSCFAIGNPFGYDHTLTTGVVSGLGREIPSQNGMSIRGAIQTDAAINAGNSGGPLIDSYGRVIGVNTATFTRKGSGVSSGVNFAIPIDSVVRTVPYLIVYGTSVNNRF